MTIERLRQIYEAEPFRPFTMHLADGRSVAIHHREFIAAAPSGRTIVVFTPDDKMHIIDLLLVTEVEISTATGKSKGNGRKKRR